MRLRDIVITPEQLEASKRHEIAVRYDRMARRSRNKTRTFAAIRAAELTRLFRSRYGRTMPASDEGKSAIRIMVHHLARLRDAPRRISAWLDRHAPWLELQDSERLIREATENPLRWRADKIAWKLRVTAAERSELGLRTIGAIDQPKASRAEQAKDRKRERDQARRRSKGMRPRSEYESQSISRQMPWKDLSMSRAAWYRAGKPQP